MSILEVLHFSFRIMPDITPIQVVRLHVDEFFLKFCRCRDVLLGAWGVPQVYDEPAIWGVLTELTPGNLRIMWASRDFKVAFFLLGVGGGHCCSAMFFAIRLWRSTDGLSMIDRRHARAARIRVRRGPAAAMPERTPVMSGFPVAVREITCTLEVYG
jgi:hypothetical protein